MANLEIRANALPDTADVIVVGAGLVGLATAFYAARAGLGRVVVLEARDQLAGLTAAASAAGFRLEWDAPENIDMVRSSIETYKNFAEVIGRPGYSIDIHLAGYLFLSGKTDEARREARFAERVEWWHSNGLTDVELLTGDQARARWPFLNDNVEAAHFRRDEGYLNVADAARGFVLGGGFTTYLASPVESITTRSGQVTGVRLAYGQSIASRTVVVAAGPFSAQLCASAGASISIVNKRRHALVLPAASEVIDPSWPVVLDSELGMYWRPRTDGRTLTGIYIGWERALPWDQHDSDPVDPVPADPRYMDAVREYGSRLTTIWDRLQWENAIWKAGQYTSPGREDGRPMIGRHHDVPGLYVNTAYEGRGIMAAPGGAELLVKTITSADCPEAKPFSIAMSERAPEPDRMVL